MFLSLNTCINREAGFVTDGNYLESQGAKTKRFVLPRATVGGMMGPPPPTLTLLANDPILCVI